MNGRLDAERILDVFLAPEADRLPDRALDAALDEIARTPQRRAMRVPWRFPLMPALSRATGIAAVVLVAIVGAGGITYFAAGGPGPSPTLPPTPAPPATRTASPTVAVTPQASMVAPGVYGWKTYTSPVYGYTIPYPDDWSVTERATQKWEPGAPEDGVWDDVFFNNAPEGPADDSMVFVALQIPAPAGADLRSWSGLDTALTEMCASPEEFYLSICPGDRQVTRLCLGSSACQPVALLHGTGEQPRALFGDPDTGLVTYIHVGRTDDFPAATRYGGTVRLLESILVEMGARDPLPSEIPD